MVSKNSTRSSCHVLQPYRPYIYMCIYINTYAYTYILYIYTYKTLTFDEYCTVKKERDKI